MKITIDTKEDSKQEIERIANFLMHLASRSSETKDFEPEVKEGTFGMFDEPKKPEKEPFNINKIIEY